MPPAPATVDALHPITRAGAQADSESTEQAKRQGLAVHLAADLDDVRRILRFVHDQEHNGYDSPAAACCHVAELALSTVQRAADRATKDDWSGDWPGDV